ncbi:MAG: HAD-IB family phosphatase, partial [Pseudomonadota bacterium]
MKSVLTLLCNPADPVLSKAWVSERVGAAAAGQTVAATAAIAIKELGPGVAYDVSVASADAGEAEAALQTIAARVKESLSDAPVDLVLQPEARRRKRILVADMDSTIIQQECIDELADFAGLRTEISAITERAMRGELDFEGALTERVRMLKGLPADVLQKTFDERITLTPGARALARTMGANGAVTLLCSGGFTFFTERVAAAAGFAAHRA